MNVKEARQLVDFVAHIEQAEATGFLSAPLFDVDDYVLALQINYVDSLFPKCDGVSYVA